MQANGKTDIQLIEGCISGNIRCQEMLYKRYFSFAMSVCLRYTGNTDEAMQVVNDSYIKVYDNLKNFNKSRNFKSWFARIVINTAIDYYRKNFKHKSMILGEDYTEKVIDNPGSLEELDAKEIIKLFAELPDIYRITFNLYEIEGYSHEEIGEILGFNTSTSRSYLARAKKMLRFLYEKHFNAVKKCYESV